MLRRVVLDKIEKGWRVREGERERERGERAERERERDYPEAPLHSHFETHFTGSHKSTSAHTCSSADT